MLAYIFYMFSFFCVSAVAGACIYLSFFKEKSKENHIKNSNTLYKVLIAMAWLLMLLGTGQYFSQLIKL